MCVPLSTRTDVRRCCERLCAAVRGRAIYLRSSQPCVGCLHGLLSLIHAPPSCLSLSICKTAQLRHLCALPCVAFLRHSACAAHQLRTSDAQRLAPLSLRRCSSALMCSTLSHKCEPPKCHRRVTLRVDTPWNVFGGDISVVFSPFLLFRYDTAELWLHVSLVFSQ